MPNPLTAERRAQYLPEEQQERSSERLRRARGLIGGTNALQRFVAWRAPTNDKIGQNPATEAPESIWGYPWGHIRHFAF